MEEVDEFVESMTARGIQVPRYGMNNFLRILRESLVRKAIDIVENRDKHIYMSGAAGVGKTMLLLLIAIQLKKEGKRSIIIAHSGNFSKCWDDIEEILKDKEPLYVLVDEAHHTMDNPVWMYLKQPKKPFFTIAAGITEEPKVSSIFQNHITVQDMLLTVEDLLASSVLEFFTDRLCESLRSQDIITEKTTCTEIVRKVLLFTHQFTNGHTFPCLKLAEFYVTAQCKRCLYAVDIEMALTQALAPSAFEEVYEIIFNRCFYRLESINTVEQLTAAWWAHSTYYINIPTLLQCWGMWLPQHNCMISLLLQQVLLKRRNVLRVPVPDVSYESFGSILAFALKFLRAKHFELLTDGLPFQSERCEDGLELYIAAVWRGCFYHRSMRCPGLEDAHL